jgi:HSP20 family protein
MAAATTLGLMHNHVRAIYRALTGEDLPQQTAPQSGSEPSMDEVNRRFAELDSLARHMGVTERVPPYAFRPPLDLLQTERELIIEMGVPGVELHDVDVELREGTVTVSGTRSGDDPQLRSYYHAELPRGSFHRVVNLPQGVSGEPRVEVENGIIRVRLQRQQRTVPAKA